ncbi:hypothetical protein HD554DRAFT_1244913 [Boletus coccyginus]|nr:hypothetical protein HD554DRAFT_1244913 [Boletus coccyginus]
MSIPSTVLSQVFIRKLCAFAGYSFLVYDYLLTFSLEVAYIWDDPWSIVKILFLVNRYGSLIGQTFVMLEETGYVSHNSKRFCSAFELFVPFFVILTGESIRLLVVMRACAIFGCKRHVVLVWNILYVLYAMVVLGVTAYLFNHAANIWPILFITLALDSFILVIVYYSVNTKVSRDIHRSRLFRLLSRDALFFYIATLFNSLLCIVCWTVFSQDPRNFLQLMLSTPFLSVVGQRLVFNLRRLRAQPDSTHDISREIARQVAEMPTFGEQSLDLDLELELARLGEHEQAAG